MGEATEKMIARNALQYLTSGGTRGVHRDGKLTLPTIYPNLRCQPLYKDPVLAKLQAVLEQRVKRRRTRLRTKTNTRPGVPSGEGNDP